MSLSKSESAIQQAFFAYVRIMTITDKRYKYIFSVPNQGLEGYRGYKHTSKLLLEGMRPGMSDIIIAYPSKGYHAGFIELKTGKNKASEAQLDWIKLATEAGYFATIHTTDNWLTLKQLVEDYFRE